MNLTSSKFYILDSNMPGDWFNFLPRVGTIEEADFVIVTDQHLDKQIEHPNKLALLIESPEIHPQAYTELENSWSQYKAILTFDKDALEYPNSIRCLMGGGWIQPIDWKLYPKNKNISMVVSSKKWAAGHILRHRVMESFGDYLEGKFGYMNPIPNNYQATLDFKFNICVENAKKDYYFSEKVMDCFATGTVPIYWGCPSIGDFFDTAGIIQFDSVRELNKILLECNEELYQKMLPAVEHNLQLQKEYWSYEKNIARALESIE